METRVLSELSSSMPHANALHRFCHIYGNQTWDKILVKEK